MGTRRLISSLQNAQVKDLVRLANNSKVRQESNTCLIEGQALVLEALKRKSLQQIFIKEQTTVPDALHDFGDLKTDAVLELSASCFAKVSQLKNNTIMATATLPDKNQPWKEFKRLLVADRIQDPNNLGAIIRSAHAASFDAVLLIAGCADCFHPRSLRASMGSSLSLPCIEVDEPELIKHLKDNQICIASLIPRATTNIIHWQAPSSLALVIGNEGQGISNAWQTACDVPLAIPMAEGVESLNALAAASIAMFQVMA